MPDYDIVVVGGGSAGCVLASHLCSMGSLKVCLVEAGPDYGPSNSGRWPMDLFNPRRLPTSHDWGYFLEASTGIAKPEERAKVIGGCSAHNQCAAIWGMPSDYDRWSEAGVSGWSYSDIKPLIHKIERANDSSESRFRGHNGVIPTRRYHDGELASWQRFFLESARGAGFSRLEDLSAPSPAEGVAPFHATIKSSVRWNGAFAFLDPVRRRPNLTILGDTFADRLVIVGGRATELVCHSQSGILGLRARLFVASAGTYGSPLLLMRSGIGPADHLKEIGVRPEIDLPAVGRNLHDHSGVGIRFQLKQTGKRELEEDLSHGQQFWNQVILRASSKLCTDEFDLHILPSQYLTGPQDWVSAIIAFNMTPLSRGRILLRGKEYLLPPKIDFQFLSDEGGRDLAVLIDGFGQIRQLANYDPVASAGEETQPGSRIVEEAEVRSYVQSNVTSYAHPVGTCKMGSSDRDSVVNSSGQVHGTKNVFVADASIIPRIPRANTNLTCYMIGLKIASDILELHQSLH